MSSLMRPPSTPTYSFDEDNIRSQHMWDVYTTHYWAHQLSDREDWQSITCAL